MGHYKGRVLEILLEPYQNAAARISMPVEAAPKPGQYLQAYDPKNPLEIIATSLFAAGASVQISSEEISLPVAGSLPSTWQPGTELQLRGPQGHGFEIPSRAKRVALAALSGSSGSLLSLAPMADSQKAEVAFLAASQVGELPFSIEVSGIDDLPTALSWADYLAISISIEDLDDLSTYVKKKPKQTLPAQALVLSPMPCGGLAKCGVCSLSTKAENKLVCEDGPVFELSELLN